MGRALEIDLTDSGIGGAFGQPVGMIAFRQALAAEYGLFGPIAISLALSVS